MGQISLVSEGIKTGNNSLFLRLWFEVSSTRFSFGRDIKGYKWYPHHKGGEFRKWYGNLDWIINWENNGKEIINAHNSGLQGKKLYFKKFAGWSKISSRGNSLRHFENNILFDSGAPAISNEHLMSTLALFNSKVGEYYLQIISPTLNLQVGDIKKVPMIFLSENTIDSITSKCINISTEDWDSYETSWNFKNHPLV